MCIHMQGHIWALKQPCEEWRLGIFCISSILCLSFLNHFVDDKAERVSWIDWFETEWELEPKSLI
jgi:hypothetical protein